MKPDASEDADSRLAARAEQLDITIAAGGASPPIEPDSLSPSNFSTLLAARESLLNLERTWPRGGSHPGPPAGMGAEPDPGSELGPPPDFGRFRIVRELGRGGFGVVLLAIDPDLNRLVALKLPLAEWLLDALGRERFVREARAVAALDHPNIATLYEAGEVHGVCYMASAYCNGPDLARWLREQGGRLDPRLAARIVADLADAIQHAHERGILHRDLKPSNVLLQRRTAGPGESPTGGPPADEDRSDPSPRIVDFGLARLLNGPMRKRPPASGPWDRRRTWRPSRPRERRSALRPTSTGWGPSFTQFSAAVPPTGGGPTSIRCGASWPTRSFPRAGTGATRPATWRRST